MIVKHYIVTYNNENAINSTLESIFRDPSDINIEYKIFIINNHSNFHLNSEYEDRVTVLHNVLRPDFSTGHLSRNWNQALINGFHSLNNPECGIVITSQDDTIFNIGFKKNIIKHHETLDFIQFGHGDNFISYTPLAVKRVGLWDERFCNIGYQEADYFLRVIKYLPTHSINDKLHGRTSNEIQNNIITVGNTGLSRGEISHLESTQYHPYSLRMFNHKWNIQPDWWNNISPDIKNQTQKCNSYILYPYFEKYVETLTEQRYI